MRAASWPAWVPSEQRLSRCDRGVALRCGLPCRPRIWRPAASSTFGVRGLPWELFGLVTGAANGTAAETTLEIRSGRLQSRSGTRGLKKESTPPCGWPELSVSSPEPPVISRQPPPTVESPGVRARALVLLSACQRRARGFCLHATLLGMWPHQPLEPAAPDGPVRRYPVAGRDWGATSCRLGIWSGPVATVPRRAWPG